MKQQRSGGAYSVPQALIRSPLGVRIMAAQHYFTLVVRHLEGVYFASPSSVDEQLPEIRLTHPAWHAAWWVISHLSTHPTYYIRFFGEKAPRSDTFSYVFINFQGNLPAEFISMLMESRTLIITPLQLDIQIYYLNFLLQLGYAMAGMS